MKEEALNAINEAAAMATKSGQLISYLKTLYKQHPSSFLRAQMRRLESSPLDDSMSDGTTRQEGISNMKKDIVSDLEAEIDANLTDEQLLEIIAKAEQNLSTEAKRKSKATDKIKRGKSKVKLGLEQWKKATKKSKGNLSASLIPGMTNEHF